MNGESGGQTDNSEKSAEKKQDASTKENPLNPPISIPPCGSEEPFNPKPTPPYQIHIHCPEEKEKPWKDKLEIAGFIVGFIVAIIFAVQMYEMIIATNTAVEQTKESHRDFIVDERAWVTATSITSSKKDGKFFFNATFKNTGKTPALNFASFIGIATATNADGVEYPDPTNQNVKSQLLPPDSISSKGTESFLTDPKIGSLIASNQIHLYVSGMLIYDDIFTNRHWTRFCWSVTMGRTDCVFYGTAIGNSCDGAGENQTQPNQFSIIDWPENFTNIQAWPQYLTNEPFITNGISVIWIGKTN